MPLEKSERFISRGLFLALLAYGVWGVAVGWNNGFLPGNEYRQTHTAITTLFIQREHNFSLAYPTPLLGKPWSIPYEFPLYQWSVAALSDATGLTLTQSARSVSAACFFLALPAAWLLLARLGVEGTRRLVVLGFVLTCPLYLFYARAFLIETMALMFSLWFLVAFVQAVERRSGAWLLVANLAGAGAGLVKVTTFLLYLLPAAACCLAWLWSARPRAPGRWPAWQPALRTLGWIAAALAVPFALTLWWIHFADALKALNLSGRQMVSANMNSYHFGSVAVRLSPDLWKTFWHTLSTNLASGPTLAAFGVIAVAAGGRWRPWIIACVLLFATAPLVFPLLYSFHEYYFSANGILLMTAIGLALAALLESRWPRWIAWLLILAVHASQVWTYHAVLYPIQHERNRGGSGLTRLLHDATGPDDVLVIAGEDWAPMIPFYSERRALMFRRGFDRDYAYVPAAFASLKGEKVTALILRGDARDNPLLVQKAREAFGFEAEPLITWADAVIYFPPELRTRVLDQFHRRPYDGVGLTARATAELDGFQHVETITADLPAADRKMFDAFSPQPVRFASRFGLGLLQLDSRLVLMAHPLSRLVFAPPPGRRQVTAEFGIVPGAYTDVKPPESPLEGVTFSIVRHRRNGAEETVFQRFLNPTDVVADRGLKALSISVVLEPGDELAFLTGPGPQGRFNRTWAYWASASIR